MERDEKQYLAPLLKQGRLPLGELVWQATGQIYPVGEDMQGILNDIQALCKAGIIRIERRHSPRHRRIERTVCLTAAGRRACHTKGEL